MYVCICRAIKEQNVIFELEKENIDTRSKLHKALMQKYGRMSPTCRMCVEQIDEMFLKK